MFHAIRYLKVTKRFPYDDVSFDYVFCSHLFVHLYYYQAIFCLSETFCVLKKGGVARIVIPALDKIVKKIWFTTS